MKRPENWHIIQINLGEQHIKKSATSDAWVWHNEEGNFAFS
jgi:hypothetical protein